MKIWSDDNPKAALMERKRAAIVAAARQVFLENGYAQASMDRIAESAAVSVKTIYRHFENKDELFSAVMQPACRADNSIPERTIEQQARSAAELFSKLLQLGAL